MSKRNANRVSMAQPVPAELQELVAERNYAFNAAGVLEKIRTDRQSLVRLPPVNKTERTFRSASYTELLRTSGYTVLYAEFVV